MDNELARQLDLLPLRLGWHVLLTAVALAAGILISMPLAVLGLRIRRLKGLLLALASIFQTVPSLAMLALLVVSLSTIGFLPAIIALTIYSILPILRNTVTGIEGVDPDIVEAARGVGMTEWQMLWRVQLPLAAPVIIAGIRTSAVWVVGIATLSTPVGQVSLGNYIFEGLQLRNNWAVMTGVVAAALLAIALDGLIRILELASVRRRRKLFWTAAAGLTLIVGGGFSPLLGTRPDTVVVGSKNFTEQYILADLIAARLRAAGFEAENKPGMGSAILFESLASGSVDVYVDYTGTIWLNIMKRSNLVAESEMLREMSEFLEKRYHIVTVGALGFENGYSLAMRRSRAEELGIKTIGDLALHADRLSIGGDYEFFGRAEWRRVRDEYGLRFEKVRSLDPTLMYAAVKNGEVDVITAFSTDGRIAADDLQALEDPKGAFPRYDAVLLVSSKAAGKTGLLKALRPLVGSVRDEAMRSANRMVDVEGRTPEEAAREMMRGSVESEKAIGADDKNVKGIHLETIDGWGFQMGKVSGTACCKG